MVEVDSGFLVLRIDFCKFVVVDMNAQHGLYLELANLRFTYIIDNFYIFFVHYGYIT